MKVFLCLLVATVAAAVSPSAPQGPPVASSSSSSSTSGSQGAPSQVANKRGDTDFATAASGQQPVYSPSIVSQQQSSHPQSASAGDYQSSPTNNNLYYYYYPGSQHAVKSEAGVDPYQTSAASSYASYASDSGSPQHVSYDTSDPSGYGGQAYQSHLQSYASQQPIPSYGHQYGPSLVGSSSQVSNQYATPSGVPVQAQNYASQAASGFGTAYQQPTYTTGASDGKSRLYGLGSVIMPLVGLGALAFLLPSVTNLGGKKKTKRSADLNEANKANGVAEYAERLEKYFKIYRAAVESDDCMNRIVCELGDSVSTVRGKAALLALFEKVAPQWMTGKMGVFKFGALNDKSAKCARYKC